MAHNNNHNNGGTAIPPSREGTAIPPQGSGTAIPPKGSGTAIPPKGSGTAVPPSGSGTAIPPNGGGTGVPPKKGETFDNQKGIPLYDSYVIKGMTFKVLQTVGKQTGEGRVFIVENGGVQFALKLYCQGYAPKPEVLDAVKGAGGGFLVYLRDHGYWSDPKNSNIRLYYEVMDYIKYGSASNVTITSDKQFKDVAKYMAFCLKQCHDLGFIHRDVKPDNFLCPDAGRTKFVLSDFGIGRMLNGKKTINADLGKTGRYASPEACYSSDNVTVEVGMPTDYYSLGMTLLALCIGPSKFNQVCPEGELNKLKRRDEVMKFFSPMLKLSDYSKSLIAALITYDPDKRAGFKEFEEWMNGKTLTTASNAKAEEDEKNKFRIVFDEDRKLIAHSPEELAAMMLADSQHAKNLLYRGTIVRALDSVGRTRLATKIDEIINREYPDASAHDAGLYATCLTLDESIVYTSLSGKKCQTLMEISKEVWANRDKYTQALRDKYNRLWVYINMRGDEKAKVYLQWQSIVESIGIHGVYGFCKAIDRSIPYHNKNNKVFNSPKSLAAELSANASEYANELTNPNHSVWLFLRVIDARGAAIAKEYPAKIKKMKVDGIFALCLELDKSTSYKGYNGEECKSLKEIADELWDLTETYKKDLANPNHALWQVFAASSDAELKRLAREYPQKIKDDPNVWLFDLIYRLDPTKPYLVCVKSTGKWKHIHSIKELFETIYKEGMNESTLPYLCQADFITWLTMRQDSDMAARASVLESEVNAMGMDLSKKKGWYLLFYVFPELSLTLQTDSKQKDYIYTKEQIGGFFNRVLYKEAYSNVSGHESNYKVKDMIEEFKADPYGSRLGEYMEARKLTSYVDGLLKIFDLESNAKAHPSAPYTFLTSIFKAVCYMGAKPSSSFRNLNINSLEDVKKLSQSDRNEYGKYGVVEFCSLFFHEKPNEAFSFNNLKDYFHFISSYFPNYSNVQNGIKERQRLDDAVKGRKRAWQLLSQIRIWTAAICIPLVLYSLYSIITMATSNTDGLASATQSIGVIVAWIVAIGFALLIIADNIIAAVICGVIAYWVVIAVFNFLSGFAAYILIGIVGIAMIWALIKLFKSEKDTYFDNDKDFNNAVSMGEMRYVTKGLGTFSTVFGYNSYDPIKSINGSKDIANDQKSKTIKAMLRTLAITALAIGLSFGINYALNNSFTQKTEITKTPTKEEFTGKYVGTFGAKNNTAEIVFNELTDNKISADLVIQYSKPMKILFMGTYNPEDGMVEAYRADKNLDTYITGNIVRNDMGKITFTGTYINPRTGTRHEFSFVKQKAN